MFFCFLIAKIFFFFFPNWISERERERLCGTEQSRVVQDKKHVNIVRTSEVLKQTNRKLKTHCASDDLTFVCQIIERVWGGGQFPFFSFIQLNLSTFVQLCATSDFFFYFFSLFFSCYSLCFILWTGNLISYLTRQAREVRGPISINIRVDRFAFSWGR